MLSPRWRPVLFAALAIVSIWVVAMAGYSLARRRQATAESVKAYIERTDLSSLSGERRAHAIRELADMLNALPLEERRKARLERLTWAWLKEMNEQEKAAFIECTAPIGFQQMLSAFEQLPQERRAKAIEDSMRRLQNAMVKMQTGGDLDGAAETNTPLLSAELQAQIRSIGLREFYSQSSAETKAELAPVLEELQRVMESGRPFRTR